MTATPPGSVILSTAFGGDRVLGALSRAYGLERGSAAALGGTGKSFFLTRLLREVVFAEAALAVAAETAPS